MEKPVLERVKDSLNNLEDLFEKNIEAQKHIEELIRLNFQDASLTHALEGIETMYGEEISISISRLLSFPTRTLEVVQEGTYKFEEYYKLLILKYRLQFLRLRQYEEIGHTTLMKMSEDISGNVFNYYVLRADNTYFDFKVSHENQLGVINYLVSVLNKHISTSETLELEDLNDFKVDLEELIKCVGELESNIDNKFEELTYGNDQ